MQALTQRHTHHKRFTDFSLNVRELWADQGETVLHNDENPPENSVNYY